MISKVEGSNFWRYGYDSENRLVSASTRKTTVRYRYDALGRRVQRYTIGGRENTKFIYDGQDVLVDDNSGTLTKYINGAGIDNKLRAQTGSTVNYFLADHLGSTNGLTDASGNLTASTSYDAFGNATNANLPTRYQFTGREYDNFTGLHYYRARFYDANLGRFISQDPIGFKGGDINLYGYVKNNPTNLLDPLGLDIRAYYRRKGGKDGGGKLEVYDNDIPPKDVWIENPNFDVNQPVGSYQPQYSGAVVDTGMFSGTGEGCINDPTCELTPFRGPIPAGNYAIRAKPDDRGWYWLYRQHPDGSYSDLAPIGNSGVTRGNFRWHLGSLSYGCLTFSYDNANVYKSLDDIIKRTSKNSFYNKDIKSNQTGAGFLTVY
jgi:RHS repeat-associated protein